MQWLAVGGSYEYPGALRWNAVFADAKSSSSAAGLNMGAWYLMTRMVFYVCWMIMQGKKKDSMQCNDKEHLRKAKTLLYIEEVPILFHLTYPHSPVRWTKTHSSTASVTFKMCSAEFISDWTRFSLPFLYYSQSEGFKWFITAKEYSLILASRL